MRRERLGNRADLVKLANWESEKGEAAEKTARPLPVVTGMRGCLHWCHLCFILCKITCLHSKRRKKKEIDMFTHFKCSEIKLYRAAVILLYSLLIHSISFCGAKKKHQI